MLSYAGAVSHVVGWLEVLGRVGRGCLTFRFDYTLRRSRSSIMSGWINDVPRKCLEKQGWRKRVRNSRIPRSVKAGLQKEASLCCSSEVCEEKLNEFSSMSSVAYVDYKYTRSRY